MKKGQIVRCEKCGESYYYESTGNPWPGGKDHETAYCPYCNAEGPSELISGFIHTFKLGDNGKPIRWVKNKDCKFMLAILVFI